MKFEEAKQKYIQTWGSLATQWGTNRTMAQIHALLLISPKALSTEEIMEELKISRGNANMNLRALLDWGIVGKDLIPGERKEYFRAQKDILEMFKQIVRERKKRELEPIINILKELKNVEEDTEEARELKNVLGEIEEVTQKSNDAMEIMMKVDNNWFFDKIIKLLK